MGGPHNVGVRVDLWLILNIWIYYFWRVHSGKDLVERIGYLFEILEDWRLLTMASCPISCTAAGLTDMLFALHRTL